MNIGLALTVVDGIVSFSFHLVARLGFLVQLVVGELLNLIDDLRHFVRMTGVVESV